MLLLCSVVAFTSDFADAWSSQAQSRHPTLKPVSFSLLSYYKATQSVELRWRDFERLPTSRGKHNDICRENLGDFDAKKGTKDRKPKTSIPHCRQQRASRVRYAYSGYTHLAGIHRPQSPPTPCFTLHSQISSARRAPFPHGTHTRDERRSIKRQTPESLFPSLHILSVSHRQNRTEQNNRKPT